MYDKELVLEILNNIAWSIDTVTKRFRSIRSMDDFSRNDIGLEKLDSICMQLINIGEALKQVDKLTESKLLVKYHEIDWKKAKGMRDIITHHYFDVDAETVFVVCSEHLPKMKIAVDEIMEDLGG